MIHLFVVQRHCSSINTNNIFSWVNKGSCKVKGKLTPDDLTEITHAIVNSCLLSEEEIEIYFTA